MYLFIHRLPHIFCHFLQALKECFETKNVARLQGVLNDMPKEDASYHMQRCIDSGLWVTDAKAAGTCTLILHSQCVVGWCELLCVYVYMYRYIVHVSYCTLCITYMYMYVV